MIESSAVFQLLFLVSIYGIGGLIIVAIIGYDIYKSRSAPNCRFHPFRIKKVFTEDGLDHYECSNCGLREAYGQFGTPHWQWLEGGPREKKTHDENGKPLPPGLRIECRGTGPLPPIRA